MRVPTYDSPTQLPGVGPTQTFNTPQMSDAPARQLQQGGAAMASAGQGMVSIATDIQKDINEAEVKKADLAVAENIDRLMRAPGADGQPGGFLTRLGEDAVKSYGGVQQDLQKVVEDGAAGLNNPIQREMYQRAAAARLRGAMGEAMGHAAQQTKVFAAGQATARAGRFAQELVQFAGQDEASQAEFNRRVTLGLQEIEVAARATGKGDAEQLKAAQDQYKAGAYAGVLQYLFANKRAADAVAFWEARKGDLPDDEAKAKLTNAVANQAAAFKASSAADEAWSRLGPKGLNGTVNSSAIDAFLREQFKDDPDGLKAARAEINVREGNYKTDRNDRAATLQGQLLDDYLTGKIGSIAALKARPEFQALNGTGEQGKLLRYVEDYAHARATRNQGDMERKGYMAFLEAADPATLGGMTRQQVLVQAKMLGPSLGTQLVNRYDALQKPGAAEQVRIDDDDFKTAVSEILKIDAFGKLDSDEKAMLGKVRSRLELALSSPEMAKMSREQRANFVRKELAQTVLVSDSALWNKDRTKTVNVVNLTREDLDLVVVPQAQRSMLQNEMRAALARTGDKRFEQSEYNLRRYFLLKNFSTTRYIPDGK